MTPRNFTEYGRPILLTEDRVSRSRAQHPAGKRDSRLRPARGVLYGAAISVVLWAAAIFGAHLAVGWPW